MSYHAKKPPLVGSLTTSVSLALVVHGALLLLIIGFTIERVARPKSLTDSAEVANSILMQEAAQQEPKPGPIVEIKREPEPVGAPDGVKVAVAIPTVESNPTPPPSEFHPRPPEQVSTTPPPPKQLGNPAPKKISATASAKPAAPLPATGGGAAGSAQLSESDGAKSGVVAFTNVKGESAKRVVYVIDGSGSMAVCLPFIRAELLRSVARLDDSQSFQIVVFREPPAGSQAAGTFVLNPRKGGIVALLAASDLNKSILRDWMETVQPIGRSTPLSGLETALTLQPDLIFLLSRGIKRSGASDVEGTNRTVLARLESLNPVNPITRKRRTIIKALQFIDEDPTGLMQDIARSHGDSTDSYRVIPVPERWRTGSPRSDAPTRDGEIATSVVEPR